MHKQCVPGVPSSSRTPGYEANPLFKAGHIQSILVSCKGNHFFIKCICLLEMKKDIVYSLDLTLDNRMH